MRSYAGIDIQTKIYEALKDSVGAPVYDEVQDNSKYPYVVIGEDTSVDNSTKTEHLDNFNIVIKAFSNKKGMKEVKTIIKNIIETMDVADFTMDDFIVIKSEIESTEFYKDPEGIRNGYVRLSFLIQQI